ncbi:hypothetical protein HYR99_10375 [Candidatus Poribacteria bacterium]|nr:hypothetical protein [Candidatus Poribacteria bacterium]
MQKKTTYSLLLFLLLNSLPLVAGCLSASTAGMKWSENIAVYAASQDSKLDDDNINTVGETSSFISKARDQKSSEEADKYTQATLEWGKPQPIQRIIVKADVGQLEFFDVEYQDTEGNWKTLRKVKNHLKEVYQVELSKPIVTRKLRLKVPRKWASRQIKGQKRSKLRAGRFGNAQNSTYKKIREIEVYYALPPGESATAP